MLSVKTFALLVNSEEFQKYTQPVKATMIVITIKNRFLKGKKGDRELTITEKNFIRTGLIKIDSAPFLPEYNELIINA